MSALLFDDHARELVGMNADWSLYRFEAVGNPNEPPMIYRLRGAVAPPFKSGPRKGKPNWSKKDPATDKEVCDSAADHRAWGAAWERRTGLCSRCGGEGRTLASSGRDGKTYRDCRECGGNGKTRRETTP